MIRFSREITLDLIAPRCEGAADAPSVHPKWGFAEGGHAYDVMHSEKSAAHPKGWRRPPCQPHSANFNGPDPRKSHFSADDARPTFKTVRRPIWLFEFEAIIAASAGEAACAFACARISGSAATDTDHTVIQ